ncbi:MAG: TRAP transporter small permease [Deltaproteobacteria bacterium]|nr:TRAP transporter small permease [Deltaproteobacteria bacterium]MBW2306885.1 TRAP transporter small permease [Deltaproteobacteria bacterium]
MTNIQRKPWAPAAIEEQPVYQKLADYAAVLNRLGTNLAGLGLLVMTGLVMTDVIMRRLFNAPIIFADEAAGYLLVLVTFLGLSYTLKEDGHIQVKIIVDYISPKKRAFLKLLWCVFGIIFTMLLFVLTSELAWESYDLKAFSPTPSQLPLFPFQIVLPIGCLLLLLQLVVGLMDSALSLFSSGHLKNRKKE